MFPAAAADHEHPHEASRRTDEIAPGGASPARPDARKSTRAGAAAEGRRATLPGRPLRRSGADLQAAHRDRAVLDACVHGQHVVPLSLDGEGVEQRQVVIRGGRRHPAERVLEVAAVSYTHLTLPTIYSV